MINSRITDLLSGYWIIASKVDNNKVLDVNNDASENNVTIWTRNNGDNQQWKIECDIINRAFIIKCKSNNKVLCRSGGSYPGDDVYLTDQSDATFVYPSQRWYLHYDCAGYYTIANFRGDYVNPDVLDLPNDNTTNGTDIKVLTNTGRNGQKFCLIRP